MKRGNMVLMMGTLTDVRVSKTLNSAPVVRAMLLDEDIPSDEGPTGIPVVAYGRLASEVAAFYRQGVVDCAVLGWLRCRDGKTEVVASRISFVVTSEGRKQAAQELKRIGSPNKWRSKSRVAGEK